MDVVQDLPVPRRKTKSPRPPSKSPRRQYRPLGTFMTPQVPHAGRSSRHVRYSVGGFTPGGIHGAPVAPLQALPTASAAHTGARRVRVVEPWKVEDIVIPTAGGDDVDEEEHGDEHEGEWVDEEEDDDEEAVEERYDRSINMSMSMSPSKRPAVSEEERKVRLFTTGSIIAYG